MFSVGLESLTSLMKCLGFQVVLLAVLCFPSLLCFSSSWCLCSVAASMSPAFSAAVTCCHSLLSIIVTKQDKNTRNAWFTDHRMNTAHNLSVWKESCLKGVWLIWLYNFFHAYIWLWNNTPQIKLTLNCTWKLLPSCCQQHSLGFFLHH